MSLALIARADTGGLGVQTHEIARHLRPDRVLVVKIDPPRGTFEPDRYDAFSEVRIAGHIPTTDDLEWLCECSEILTVEGCYNDTLIDLAHHAGVRLSVHANPELFGARYHAAAAQERLRVLAPTDWALDRLPNPVLLWMPVATDRIHGHIRMTPPRTFLHTSAPAMLDRNGTQLVYAAAKQYRGPRITVRVAGPHRPKRTERVGHVVFEPVPDVEHYWQRYTDDLDALVLPRRYGGLSLVMQEAMAAGLPVVCLDRDPEQYWQGTRRVPVDSTESHRMKAGPVDVARCTPKDLADALLAHVEANPVPLSSEALKRAQAISWNALHPRWKEVLA